MPQDSDSGIDLGLDRRTFLGAAGAVGVAATVPAVGAAATAPRAKVDTRLDLDGGPQEVLVVFDRNEHVSQLGRFSLAEGYHRFEVLPVGYTIATGPQIRRIAALDSVLRVEPNAELEYHNDDARAETGVASVQAGGNRGEKAHVAVVDSGLSALHPDHQQNVRHNYKYQNPLSRDTAWVDVGKVDTDDNGHGTHTSGSIAGDGTQSDGTYRGMAPEADLTVYSTGLTLLVVNTVAAFDHLLANHTAETAATPEEVVHVTNNSYGPTSGNDADFQPTSAFNVATYLTYEAGILHCFSAGNSGPDTDTYSNYAKAPWVVGVAATDDSRELASFSSRGRTDGSNYDRDLALANVREFYTALFGDGGTRETTGQTGSFSGGPAAGAVVVGLNQTTDSFTVQSASGSVSFTPDRYEVDATLTWSPANAEGAEPSDLDFSLLDANGTEVATSGSGGSETQDEPTEELTGVVEAGASYSFEVTGWRGAANWEVSYEVFAVDAGEADPSPPYGVYRPDVGTPGVAVVSTMGLDDPLQAAGPTYGEDPTVTADPYYAAISGTSMSSPVTAGIAALAVHAYVDEYPEVDDPTAAYPDPNTVFEALEAGAVFDESKGHTPYNIGKGFLEAPGAVAAARAAARADAEPGRVDPVVDDYVVSEARKPDPHAEITAWWAVSDGDGDLETVLVEVVDADTDEVVRSAETSVSGDDASGSDEFTIRNSDGQTFDVVLTVTDAVGGTATAMQSVTERDDVRRRSGL